VADHSCPWNVETLRQHFEEILRMRQDHFEQLLKHSEQLQGQRCDALAGTIAALERSATTAIREQEKSVTVAMSAADRAVQKAETAAEKRFEGVNEFRAQLGDQQRNLIPRAEVDVIVRGLTEKIGSLEKAFDAAQAERLGLKGGWGYAVGVIGFVLAVLSIIGALVTLAVRMIP
jgi:hypothetical protein